MTYGLTKNLLEVLTAYHSFQHGGTLCVPSDSTFSSRNHRLTMVLIGLFRWQAEPLTIRHQTLFVSVLLLLLLHTKNIAHANVGKTSDPCFLVCLSFRKPGGHFFFIKAFLWFFLRSFFLFSLITYFFAL